MNVTEPTKASSPSDRRIAHGQTLLWAGSIATLWRVQQGVFRLEHPLRDGQAMLHLALAGDLLGVEALCTGTFTCTCTVTALTDCVATPEPAPASTQHTALLAAAFRQQQQQALDMALLRSGTVVGRLAHLLKLLARRADGTAIPLERKALPPLKDLAQIIDSTPETVCRELNRLLPARKRQAPVREHSLWLGAAGPFAPAF